MTKQSESQDEIDTGQPSLDLQILLSSPRPSRARLPIAPIGTLELLKKDWQHLSGCDKRLTVTILLLPDFKEFLKLLKSRSVEEVLNKYLRRAASV